MRTRSKVALGAGTALVCAGSAACSGLLGDFSIAGSSPADASAGEPGGDAAIVEASTPVDSSSPPPTDGSAGVDDASDAQVPRDAGCGATCATGLSANGKHSCAVMGDQSVYCWGSNVNGESGPGAGGPAPTRVTGIGPARIVRSGDEASCAILVDDSVWCWGNNGHGELGVPDAAPVDGGVAPVEVFAPGTVADLLMGAYHACVLTTAASPQVLCWGDNQYGQAGVADASTVHVPASVALTDVGAMSAGAFTTCFVRTTAPEGECMGENVYGELGRGGSDDGGIDDLPHPMPAAVNIGALGGARGFYHSAGYHMGAVFTSGQIALWGDNNDGQLGPQNDSGAPDPNPTLLSFSEATTLTMTQYATCASRVDGTVWCWGSTADGQTGSAANLGPIQVAPSQVLGLSDAGVSVLAGGLSHVCALLQGGAIECWGFNNFGQLGRTTTATFDPTPAPVVF